MAEKKSDGKGPEKALNEIARLGEKLESAMRAAAQRPEVKEVQAEVVVSVRRLGEHVAKAVSAAAGAADSEQGRAVRAQVQGAAKALRANLASGLKAVAKELSELGEKLETKDPPRP